MADVDTFNSSMLRVWQNGPSKKGAGVLLLVRPGDYVFPGAPIALVKPKVDGAEDAIRSATALGAQRGSSADIEFAVRQLVEVAVRGLSPGINNPLTQSPSLIASARLSVTLILCTCPPV